MVVESKILAIVIVGLFVTVGGMSCIEPDGSEEDNRPPVSKVLPAKGLYYLWFEPLPRGDQDGDPVPPEGPPAGQSFGMAEGKVLSEAFDSGNLMKDDGIVIRWGGKDGHRGTGISHYDIQIRIGEDGQWTDWKTHTTDTSAMYYPEEEGDYFVRCRAVDNAGNEERYPEHPEARFTVKVIEPGDLVDWDTGEVMEVLEDAWDGRPQTNCPP